MCVGSQCGYADDVHVKNKERSVCLKLGESARAGLD